MHYECTGHINVSNTPKGVDAVRTAINQIIDEEEQYGDCTEIIEALDFKTNGMEYYGTADYDDMDDMNCFFGWIKEKVIELYPNCSMDAHFNGSNSSSGAQSGFTTQLRGGHVRELEYEMCEDGIPCPNPDCGCSFVYFGSVIFDYEYDCDECGRHFSVDEMNEILSEYIDEYDLEIDESNDSKDDDETVERIELELSGKKVVTTGLSIEDEKWVKEQVESRGGIFKPHFVVTLDYLVCDTANPGTVKFNKAKEQIEKGKPVQIITFEQFRKSL